MSQQSQRTTLERATDTLHAGGLVAFPTETVYGLGADARNPDALGRIFAAKGRPADHPVIVHLASSGWLSMWARDLPDTAYALAEAFWPGPLTLILKRREDVSDAVTGGQDTVGVRVPAHPLALELLTAFGSGVAAPSANRFGRISPTTAEHVRNELGAAVDVVLDGGACRVGLESTILDLSGPPRVLRPGGVSLEQLTAVLGHSPRVTEVIAKGGPRAPGTLASHYAPTTPARLVPSDRFHEVVVTQQDRGVAVLARSPSPASLTLPWRTLPDDPRRYGEQLYATLRELDALGVAEIIIEAVPDTPAWLAVRDRLGRATTLAPTPTEARAL